MDDWLLLSYTVAIWYGIVAIVVAFNKKHKELCDSFGIDYRFVAIIWLPFCLFVLVASLFFNEK